MRSQEGIRGREKYDIPYGMVLLDGKENVVWKQKGLQFSRSQVKSQLDSVVNQNE